ncbi:AbrB/MazE/SpoVT family DNA-binding domain-containing protein (plasmid) [Brevundimonas olei]|uniref:AbrB/MazE/SpoVT family DNA-binding domain-containing protein n=1 Tax=Brevundimonas olei TaxID=657642 RepID=A0ABZ2IHK5_9CAUL
MIISKIGPKAQTTIPGPVRTALNLGVGDHLEFDIQGERVFLKKVPEVQAEVKEDPFALFSEWDSEADRRAYAAF